MDNLEIKELTKILEDFYNQYTSATPERMAEFLYKNDVRVLEVIDLRKYAQSLKEELDYTHVTLRDVMAENKALQGQVNMVKLIFGGRTNGNN